MKDMEIEFSIINTTEQIGFVLDWLVSRHAHPVPSSPIMYVDLEGVNLCREGSISIFTLLVDIDIITRGVFLIDVHTLGAQAFNTPGAKKTTLKDMLEDEKIPKVFFDVRNDSDALFTHFGVALQGIEDVQLMESATRKTTAYRKYLNGLAKCVENKLPTRHGGGGLAAWKLAKEKGERLFKAEHGGSYEVFNQRPIPDDIISYCVGDVRHLPELRDTFYRQQTHQWRKLVGEEAKKRVATSQRSDYQPHSLNKALTSWNKEQNMILHRWYYVPPPHNDFEDFFDESTDLYDDWEDDYGMSCRDVIFDWDDYYSD
ncbi:hypothetical protein PTNB73_10496 [Pyrenophora teres f. teres]|nr:hypothetical protein HRS9122_03559 [Pyrenophora teres f. teres]KAE8854299.1 hypothetical protein PTNB73_10496 [Pyrenophora teres f. teres]